MTQKNIAVKIGVSRLVYQAIEAGRKRLTRAMFDQICDAIGCDPAALMRDAGYKFIEETKS